MMSSSVSSISACGAICLLLTAGAPAQEETLHSYFSKSEEEPRHAQVTISPCGLDEAEECAHHSLSCSASSWPETALTIIVGDIDKIATQLIVGTEGQPQATAKLAGGATTVTLSISSVHVDRNELDGGWVLALGISDAGTLFDALTDKSSEGAAIVAADKHFELAPEAGDGAKLLALKEACANMRN